MRRRCIRVCVTQALGLKGSKASSLSVLNLRSSLLSPEQAAYVGGPVEGPYHWIILV